MSRKGLFAVVCLIVVTAVWAWAGTLWQLQTKLVTAGGTIQVRGKLPVQTSGIKYYNFTTAATTPIPVVVKAITGYEFSSIVKNGASQTFANTTSYTTSMPRIAGMTIQALNVSLKKKGVAITTSTTGPVTISPASASVPYDTAATLTVSPNTTAGVITAISPAAGTNVAYTDMYGSPVTLPFAGRMKVVLSHVTAPTLVSATAETATVEAGSNQFVTPGVTVTLHGTGAGATSYVWTQTSGPTVTLSDPNALTPTFTAPSLSGSFVTCAFRVDALGPAGTVLVSDTTNVTVSTSVSDSMRNACQNCHTSEGMAYTAFTNWSASVHKYNGQTCQSCHGPSMPTSVRLSTVSAITFNNLSAGADPGGTRGNFCSRCHASSIPASFALSEHAVRGETCNMCHTDAHAVGLGADNVSFLQKNIDGTLSSTYACLNGTCHGGMAGNIWTRDLSKSSHFANHQGSNCSSCHGTDMHAQDGAFTNKCGLCHTVTADAYASKHGSVVTDFSCRTCHTGTVYYGYNPTPTIDGSSMSFARPSSARASKHRPETFQWATSDVCAGCHAAVRTEFRATAHWNSHLETGPEFSGGAVEGQLNANESWTTTEDGAQVTCYKRCHFKPNLGQDPKATDSNTNGGLRPGKDECVACHEPHKLVATYQTTCMTCHNGSKHGKVPNEFWNSKHWQNNLETGPEFTSQMDSVLTTGTSAAGGTVTYPGTTTDGVLNANDSFTTTENGSVVTCAYRCHFRPGMGPNQNVAGQLVDGHAVNNVSYVDTLNNVTYTRPGGNACMACHDAHGLEAGYQTCLTCHTGTRIRNGVLGGHGAIPLEFWNSKHWQNNLETGPEFANQMDITTVLADVKNNGGTVAGVLNANDSYTTTENGSTVTCAYRCHFRPGMYPDTVTPPSNYINPISRKATTYIRYSTHINGSPTKTVWTRPGGNACMACHDAHGLEATAQSTCYTCHAGGNHGWSVRAFEKSSHFTGTYAILDGIGGQTGEACTACHNAHSLEAAFYTMSGSTGLVKKAAGCQKCHEPGQPYAIYDATGAGLAPHFNNVSTTAYVGPRSTCADCHSHNNTINAGWAEGGHGSVNAEAFYGRSSENFKTMGTSGNYQSDPSLRNCVRCHTAKGAMNFVTSGFTSVAAVGSSTDYTSEPLVCSGCHNNVDKGTLALANFTSQHTGVQQYVARYGYKNTTISGGNLINTAIALGNQKNSNICMPCHSQRASGQEIKDLFAIGTFKQYSAGSGIYPHAAQPAAITVGKGAYEFTTFTAPADGHFKNGLNNNNGTGTTQGPCVACHMNSAKPHNLEIDATTFTKNCQKCHPTSFNQASIDAAKADFQAAVAVLGNLLVQKGVTLDGVNPLPERKALDLSGGTKSNTAPDANGLNAQQKMGAWFNWYLFNTADPGAFAHNPSYAKKMLQDSIDVLAHGTVTGSIADVPGAAGLALGQHPAQTSTSCTQCHNASVSSADCIGCHTIAQDASGIASLDNDGVRAIMGEFNKRSHHITGPTPTNEQCAVCHAEGTASNPTATSSYHMLDGKVYLRNVDGGAPFAWDGTNHTAMDDFCFACHDADGAADVATIHALNSSASASNPFGDTLTNSYDQVARAGVVDVKTAFQTTNASHHAVSGARYQYRFSNRTNADAWALRNGTTSPADSELADGKVVGGETVNFSGHYDPEGEHEGGEATLYEADKFVATYLPLGASENVGDNSTLHCGDCHTVGQWKAGTSTNADGTTTSAIIGAHGSENDYMLRNSLGTDVLHSGQTYVCFNCHKGGQLAPYNVEGQVAVANDALWDELVAEGFISSTRVKPTWNVGWNLAHPNVFAGQVSGYATAHAVSAFHAQCQADSANQVGSSNTVKSRVYYNLNGHKDRTLDYIPAPNATASLPTAAGEGGNVTGIACTNCHNVGRTGWGGIHGGNNTYTDGFNRSQTTYRFMPGMGNYKYAPPGGWDGKDVSDSRFVVQPNGTDPNLPANKLAGKPMGGCYTNNNTTQNPGWSTCAHHGTSTVPTYGGGTSTNNNTSTSPTWEPTLREATAGNSLVTRPLKY